MRSKKKGLYCFAGHSVFGYRDVEMLSKYYDILVCHYDIGGGVMRKFFNYLTYNIKVLNRIFECEFVIINFGAWHTIFPVFLAKMLGKKSLILLGGFDAGNIPSLSYGLFHKPSMLQYLLKRTYSMATFLCPVSEALVASVNKYANPEGDGYKVGLLHFLPGLKDKIKVIPTDYNAVYWNVDVTIKKKGVLALAYVYEHQTYILKGFDVLTRCALLLPNIPFIFAGFSPGMIKFYEESAPSNVQLLSLQSRDQTRELFKKYKVFVLPSMTEGLPNTLCEAMLCGCIPIGSDVGEIPYIIGDKGFVLKTKSEVLLKEMISKALEYNSLASENTRKRIIELFPEGKRLLQLQQLIDSRI